MAPTEAQKRAWMTQWRSAEKALAKVRLAELGKVDLPAVAEQLEEASLVALRTIPPSTTSGLVIQQRLFHRRRSA